jgi:hypothetical protein
LLETFQFDGEDVQFAIAHVPDEVRLQRAGPQCIIPLARQSSRSTW